MRPSPAASWAVAAAIALSTSLALAPAALAAPATPQGTDSGPPAAARAERSGPQNADLELEPAADAADRLGNDPAAYDPRPTDLGDPPRPPQLPPTAEPADSPLAFALRPGAEVDRGAFRYRRTLTVLVASRGLSYLLLEPADLAAGRADLGDLRVVGSDGRQWPYLLERGEARGEVAARINRRGGDRGFSRYELEPEVHPVAATALTLRLAEPFFDRPFTLSGGDDDRLARLTQGRLTRQPGSEQPIRIELPGRRLDRLQLTLEDGSDAPLTVEEARLTVSLAELFLVAPPGEYQLLLGHPEAQPPRYEVAGQRHRILAVPATELTVGPLEENPTFRRWSHALENPAGSRLLLYLVLALAAVALIGLTLKLAHQERGGGGADG